MTATKKTRGPALEASRARRTINFSMAAMTLLGVSNFACATSSTMVLSRSCPIQHRQPLVTDEASQVVVVEQAKSLTAPPPRMMTTASGRSPEAAHPSSALVSAATISRAAPSP
jgi:hypothetical protein